MYKLDQTSENSLIGIAKANNYHYVGSLKADSNLPSRMIVNFPLSKYQAECHFEISILFRFELFWFIKTDYNILKTG